MINIIVINVIFLPSKTWQLSKTLFERKHIKLYTQTFIQLMIAANY